MERHHISRDRSGHFKLCFYAAILHVMDRASSGFSSFDKMIEAFPFLIDYNNELARHGLLGLSRDEACSHWRRELRAFENEVAAHLPLRALCAESGLDYHGMTLLMAVGLVEEEPRMGDLFDSAQGGTGQRRPTVGLLTAWWQEGAGHDARGIIRQLLDLGVVRVVNPEAPLAERALQIPSLFWETLRGELHEPPGSWAIRHPQERLLPMRDLIVPDGVRATVEALPSLLTSQRTRTLVVRGPGNNGRRTMLGAVASALEMDLLLVSGLCDATDERWALLGPLATLLHAMPAVVVDPAPGETVELPFLQGYSGPVGVVLGKEGGVGGAGAEGAVTVEMALPSPAERRAHWQAVSSLDAAEADAVTGLFRMSSGNIRRTAEAAAAYASLEGGAPLSPMLVRRASRSLNRHFLDTLAERLDTAGGWSDLCVSPETMSELHILESRCRYREKLALSLPNFPAGALNAGVRALFTGPSGTGKTLAARLLSSVLQKDLYRLDLATVVNKYLGETEKNLSRIFSLAEAHDVILLVDEGDALLTRRTSVQSSNDRYANLETNYLLQRMENFEGILLVTTNAANRIDTAFQRRFDIVVEFHAPEAQERRSIWHSHLPPDHAVDEEYLGKVAGYCVLSGGQIRNAVLHASLLALDEEIPLSREHLYPAIQREYRKMGAICPLER